MCKLRHFYHWKETGNFMITFKPVLWCIGQYKIGHYGNEPYRFIFINLFGKFRFDFRLYPFISEEKYKVLEANKYKL